MTSKIRALNYAEHGQVKLIKTTNHVHVSDQQIIPLIVHEFSLAGAEMPVVFVKDKENDSFQPVALMGFQAGENLFCGKTTWRGSYVPGSVMHHPLALMASEEDENQFQVILMEDSHLINETEGDALFDAQGNETEYLKKRKDILGAYYENVQRTNAFVKTLVEKDLLISQILTIDINDQKMNLSGLYLVDENKLNTLPDQEFLNLRERGYLSPIYSHMASIHQLNNLARLKKQL